MDWWLVLLILVGGLLLVMVSGLPIAFSFLLLNIVGVYIWMGGEAGLRFLTLSFFQALATFTLGPIPFFVLMGEAMFHSGLALRTLDVLDKWLGRLPGRLSLLALGSGVLFATLSGSNIANTAMLGTLLAPEMRRRGYSKLMSLGPIMGAGGLAMMIPPSALGVIWGAIAQVSIGKLLIAIIFPGLLMATFYAIYIIGGCLLNPSLAPPYVVDPTPLSQRVGLLVRDVLPLGFIVFLVIGFIFLGIATPTEAAAVGALGAFLLAAFYRRLNLKVVQRSVAGALQITIMAFTIIMGSIAFNQILAFTGASRGMVEMITGLELPPIVIVMIMQFVLLVLGTFMDEVSMIMISAPIYMPIIKALGLDPVWFGVLILINLEIALLSPPTALLLFVMKGVAPPDVTLGDVMWAAIPFMALQALTMGVVMAFPIIALWLPSMMR